LIESRKHATLKKILAPKTLNTIITPQKIVMVEPNFFQQEANPPPMPQKRQSADFEMFSKISKNVNNIAANLRIIEERYATLRNKSQLSEQSIISMEKDLRSDIRSLSEDMVDLKREMKDVKDKLRLMAAELKNLVNKNDFRVMERYVDMWQPMNFVTRSELNKLIESKSKEKPKLDAT
jgi:hypothetical protein